MSSHMNRALAEQYVSEMRHAADRRRLARDARGPGLATRLMTVLRGNTAQNGRPSGARQPAAAHTADCAPEHS
jgi:hypothetical protein